MYPEKISADPPRYRRNRAATDRPEAATLRAMLEQTVAGVFEIDGERLRSPTRGPAAVARARQVAMYLAHVGCGLTLTEVGQLFERDRTTAKHACAVIEENRDEPRFDRALDLLERIVKILSGPRELPCPAQH